MFNQNYDSNIVITTIVSATSTTSKYVDKSYITCGESIKYIIVVPNSGTLTAQNIFLKDTIPNGIVFITNSVNINGTTINGANPNRGITLPNIAPGETTTLSFSVLVQC